MIKFIVPHGKTCMDIVDFSLPRKFGGYDVSNINIHLSLLLLKPVMQYIQEKVIDNVLSPAMYVVEYISPRLAACEWFVRTLCR